MVQLRVEMLMVTSGLFKNAHTACDGCSCIFLPFPRGVTRVDDVKSRCLCAFIEERNTVIELCPGISRTGIQRLCLSDELESLTIRKSKLTRVQILPRSLASLTPV